jgi:hypothetical protein
MSTNGYPANGGGTAGRNGGPEHNGEDAPILLKKAGFGAALATGREAPPPP